MKYEDIKDFYQRCEEHPDHQSGMVSYDMILQRLNEEIDELRAYVEQRTWVGLTRDEIQDLLDFTDYYNYPQDLIANTQAKLKDKNL
jgi:replicative superfamily II helicase